MIYCLFTYFGMNGIIFVLMCLTSMYVLNFMFWVCVICIYNEIEIIVWLRVIILQSPEKGASWKFWLDPWFPRNSKSKWTLKWLPLNRGYFKFYFHKGESILIISCHTHLLTRKFCHFISSHICITMHFVLVKMSLNLVLLTNNPSKRGDVETLMRSSVFPSS